MTENPKTRKAVIRLEVIKAYLETNMAVTAFARVFNTTDVYKPLRKRHGPIAAEELDRWANICMGGGRMIKRFLRLFAEYRTAENLSSYLMNECYRKNDKITELEKIITQKEKAQDLSAAIISGYKKDLAALQSKIVSDSNLIESLNRYIAALETKINHQNELLQELKKQLEVCLPNTHK